MKRSRNMTSKLSTLLGCLTLAVGLAVLPSAADARMVVGIGVGLPFGWYGPPYYAPYYGYYGYYGPPAYPYPPVYTAPPVQYVLPPVQQGPPPVQYWYYCNRPQGYYPYVTACPGGWRQVQPKPMR